MKEYNSINDILQDKELSELLGLNEPVHAMFTPKHVSFESNQTLGESMSILASGEGRP